MTAIERIKARFSAHPEIKYSEGPNEIDVKPSENSGFSVGFRNTPTGFTVNFQGWHEEFTSEEEALDWVVESLKDGKWTPDSETGLLLQPFWRSARIEYRQNNLLGRDSIRS
jgi:hypothetical protein